MKKEVIDPKKATSDLRDRYFDAKYINDRSVTVEQLLKIAEQYISALETEKHMILCELAQHQVTHWPRIKDLPEQERVPFRQWLSGQTCPLISNLPYEEQDAYYEHDYRNWKLSLKGHKVHWD